MLGPHIKRRRDGRFSLRLSLPERGLLRMLPREAQGLLDKPTDPVVRRVFPVAYPGDAEADNAYRSSSGASWPASTATSSRCSRPRRMRARSTACSSGSGSER